MRRQTHLAYVAAEIKTNLDKTMFQEASGTAYDLRLALPNSRYFLLCERLDMAPISTAVTAIEEVIVLRKARRLPVDLRQRFSTAAAANGTERRSCSTLLKTRSRPRGSGGFRAMWNGCSETAPEASRTRWSAAGSDRSGRPPEFGTETSAGETAR